MEYLNIITNFFKHVFSPLLKALGWLYRLLPFEMKWKKTLPKLGLIESSWRTHTWTFGKRDNEVIILLDTNWQITNTLPYNLTALTAYLISPEYTKGMVLIKDINSQSWGHITIQKGYTTEMGITFTISKKNIKKSDVIKAKIELHDPTGKIHKSGLFVIDPNRINTLKKGESLVVEDSSKIKNEVIKQVVAVLKNEIRQYKIRGRREGMLGTVEWPRGAMEWREGNSKIQFLYGISSKSSVASEYAKALLNLFNKSSKPNKKLIIKTLLDRIDKKKDYRDIGYLIVFCLFEMGNLKEALSASINKLKGDKAHGFGDVLRILDILLTFRHSEFQKHDLEMIEKFIYGIDDHPFNIKERINAIRVQRMAI